MKYTLLLICACANLFGALSQRVSLNIKSEIVKNVISDKFISFAINPDVLLQENCSSSKNEWICMAKSLSPAFIKIDGFSLSNFDFADDSIKLDKEIDGKFENRNIKMKTLMNFINWTKNSDIIPVMKLDSSEKIANGKWNSVSAMKIFSIAYELGLDRCVWQLEHDCNQNLTAYLNDLKTLKLVMDSFSFGRNVDWKISGNLPSCLDKKYLESWSDFIIDAENFVDAINYDYVSDMSFLKLSPSDLNNMKHYILDHNIHLWKKFDTKPSEEENYFNWVKTLGNAALEEFSVVFKTLSEKDIVHTSLSYYLSLLHKKFTGPEVLEVSLNSESTENLSAFAHCAVLPSGRVQDGITLFIINENNKQKNVSLGFSIKENGGNMMQFILQKHKDKIILNGEEMTSEGDLKPFIIESKPFQPIHLMLPPKSIGFWIITNTNVKACSNLNDQGVLYRQLIHKQLQPNHMSKVLEEILINQVHKNVKRSADSDKKKTETEDFIPEISDKDLEDIMKRSAKLRSSSDFREFFESVGQLSELVEIEKELIKIGNSVLNIEDTIEDASVSSKTSEDSIEKPKRSLERFVRNVEEYDYVTEDLILQPDTENYENIHEEKDSVINITENKEKDDDGKSKLSKLVMPKVQKLDLEKAKEKIAELVERAKNLMKNMNETLEIREVEGEFDSSDEKAPLVALPIDPELQLKNEILKNKIKLQQLKTKLKAKIANINLKIKLKSGLPHKILKRSIEKSTDEKNSIDKSKNSKFEKYVLLKKNKRFWKKFFQDDLNEKNKMRSKRFFDPISNDLNQSEDNNINVDDNDDLYLVKNSLDAKETNLAHAKNLLRIDHDQYNSSLENISNNNDSTTVKSSNGITVDEFDVEIINITEKDDQENDEKEKEPDHKISLIEYINFDKLFDDLNSVILPIYINSTRALHNFLDWKMW